MLHPDIINQLIAAGYPIRKMDDNIYRIPSRTYHQPTIKDLLHATKLWFRSLELLDDGTWKAVNKKGESFIYKTPELSLAKLFMASKKK